MDHKHFQWTKRLFSIIFKSTLTNQVIRYKHEGQVPAKITLEQKANFFFYSTQTSQRSHSYNNTKMSLKSIMSQLKNIFTICTKTFAQYQRHQCTDALRDCVYFITFTTISTTTVI